MRRLADLPNLDGYEFWGVIQDPLTMKRTLIPCRVVRDPATGFHHVAEFDRLVGWYPK